MIMRMLSTLPSAMARQIDEVHVFEELADGERYENAASFYGRSCHVGKVGTRDALEHDAGMVSQLCQRHEGRIRPKTFQFCPCLRMIAGSHCGQRDAIDLTGVDSARHGISDGAKAGDGELQCRWGRHVVPPAALRACANRCAYGIRSARQ